MSRSTSFVITALLFFFTQIIPISFAIPLTATLDKLIYTQSDVLQLTGSIATNASVDIALSISGPTSLTTTITAVNGTFSYNQSLSNFTAGLYTLTLTSGSDSVTLDFEVRSEIAFITSMLMKHGTSVVFVNTSKTTASASPPTGANFSEIEKLNKTALHYGNATINNRNFWFLVIDDMTPGFFSTVYIDDDPRFLLFNNSEDVGENDTIEFKAREGEIVELNGTEFVIVKISGDGNAIILARIESPIYQPNENLSLLVVTTNETNAIIGNQNVSIEMLNESDHVLASVSGATNNLGYYIANFTTPNQSGMYRFSINNGFAMEVFYVERFRLRVFTTDERGNTMASFSPGSKVRIVALAKNSSGDAISLDACNVRITLPSGVVITASMNESEVGRYVYEFANTNDEGDYAVRIEALLNGQTQVATTGFSIVSSVFQAIAFNPRFMSGAAEKGPGFEVNAFAPGSNVTIMLMQFNSSFGPFGPSFVPIDDPSTSVDECESRISMLELVDEFGNDRSGEVEVKIMNVNRTMQAFNVSSEAATGAPPGVIQQCVAVINNLTEMGAYRVRFSLDGSKTAGDTFAIQLLYAHAYPVGEAGEKFPFYVPNSTMRMKIEVIDMRNRMQINASQIISVAITEMRKEFPEMKDVFTPGYRAMINESVSDGILTFLSPAEEGFYTMRFTFRVNLSGNVTTGSGTGHFMLKKYFIWAEPIDKNGEPRWFFSSGENITLKIHIIDATLGGALASGYSVTEQCTGCAGMVASVTRLFNDQLMMEIDPSAYTVIKGTVLNSTSGATVKLVPTTALPSGWYGVDIELRDPDTNKTYFGWGGFEIRNFFVEVWPVEYDSNAGVYVPSWKNAYPLGSNVTFAVIGRNVTDWSVIKDVNVTEVTLVSFATWPPAMLATNFTSFIDEVNLSKGFIENLTLFNISSPSGEGDYEVRVRVFNPTYGSDIGNTFISFASYWLRIAYPRMDKWLPTFASNEIMQINVTACGFGNETNPCLPHNLSDVVIREIHGERLFEPILPTKESDYNVSCYATDGWKKCVINLSLSILPSEGWYFIDLRATDEAGITKSGYVDFELRNLIIATPLIREVWVSDLTDSPTKELNLEKYEGSADIVPPGNFNESYYTIIDLSTDPYRWIENTWYCNFNSSLTIYIFHNTTHLWIDDDFNFTNSTDANMSVNVTGGIITDPLGGKWNVTLLDKQRVKLVGVNVLAGTGVKIDTSLSKSGKFRLGYLDEFVFCTWTSEGSLCADLDGDGNATSRFHALIADNASSNVYDVFAIDLDNNCEFAANEVFNVKANMGNRTINNKLTLLNIDPRADRVLLYALDIPGDWNELGDYKVGSTIHIPIMVRAPNGSAIVANVTFEKAVWDETNEEIANVASYTFTNCSGVCEVMANLTNVTTGGRIRFVIKATKGGVESKLEDWQQPRATLRAFLVWNMVGRARFIDGLTSFTIERYDGETYGYIPEIRNETFGAVFSIVSNDATCTTTYPTDAGTGINWTLNGSDAYEPLKDYFFYITQANATMVWIKKGDCDFSTNAKRVDMNGWYNFTIDGHVYQLAILNISTSSDSDKKVVIGLQDLNESEIPPLFQDASTKRWKLMAINVSGEIYNFILANDTWNYTVCSLWGNDWCVKKVAIAKGANFSNAVTVSISQNFTKDLYIASLGPYPDWQGVMIANYSNLIANNLPLPWFGWRVEEGDVKFTIANESELNVDLNFDGDKSDVFYLTAFDEVKDGVSEITTIVIDDDLQFTQDWWGKNETLYYDFNEIEQGLQEMRGWPYGDITFAANWSKRWNVLSLNDTSLLIARHWDELRHELNLMFSNSSKIDVIVRAFDFDGTPISNANVTVERVMYFTWLGPQDANFTANTTKTNDEGYAIITLVPQGEGWKDGQWHMVRIKVTKETGETEYVEDWFLVGEEGG